MTVCNGARMRAMKRHLALAGLLLALPALAAAADVPQAVKKAASATVGALDRAQDATVRGVRKAASAVEGGLQAAGRGVNKAASAVGLPGGKPVTPPQTQ